MSPFDINYQPNAVSAYLQKQQTSKSQFGDLFGGGDAGGGLGFNMDTLRLGLGGLQTIGNLWNSFEANNLAKDQFGYTKKITDTNLDNSIRSYNTTLEDKIRARSAMEGRPEGYSEEYIAKNSARRSY